MKGSNIIIFIIVLAIIVGIFGFAIWDMRNNTDSSNVIDSNTESSNEVEENLVVEDADVTNSTDNNLITSSGQYEGEWYISKDAYVNAEKIDALMDLREDNVITEEEFETQLQTINNDQIAELEVDEYYGNSIKFDFELTGSAPTQRVAKIEDVVVSLTNNVGTFSYIDNWGTSGNGTITLTDGQIELTLETTNASQGALWGVEGSYTFSYRLAD